MKLIHTHDRGGECLACAMVCVRHWRNRFDIDNPEKLDDSLDRIEAALAEREHLERGAELFMQALSAAQKTGGLESLWPDEVVWREAERARKGNST